MTWRARNIAIVIPNKIHVAVLMLSDLSPSSMVAACVEYLADSCMSVSSSKHAKSRNKGCTAKQRKEERNQSDSHENAVSIAGNGSTTRLSVDGEIRAEYMQLRDRSCVPVKQRCLASKQGGLPKTHARRTILRISQWHIPVEAHCDEQLGRYRDVDAPLLMGTSMPGSRGICEPYAAIRE